MKERPILFNDQMVRAILEGRKTVTRRIAKPVKHPDLGNIYAPGALVLEHEPQHVFDRACPYGQPGDRLWVREAWQGPLISDDDRPVWTGSCPCQPFSSAGEGAGFDDPRHLWPHFAWLIRQRRPGEVLGEQVASKDAEPWLDLVQADLEAMEYAFGAVAFPSAGVGAPHIRDRTYWVGHAVGKGLEKRIGNRRMAGRKTGTFQGQATERTGVHPGRLADLYSERCREARQGELSGERPEWAECDSDSIRPGPVNGLWADADWIFCRDGKWRPVEPGTFPLAHGAPSRVGRLRAYGNAINAEAATQFIAAYMETS
ncbi:TPA: DNA cytosine methyltransferase [Pseudomonas aeruginosa]